MKIDEARTKGREYASRSEVKWSLSAVDDPMTDDKNYTVVSVQSNGAGAVANVEGTCKKPGQATFIATLAQASQFEGPLGLPDFAGDYIAGTNG